MTYIGIRQRESRPQEPKGSRSQKKRRLEEKETSVDWKLIVEISLLLSFFFSLSDKSDKDRREEEEEEEEGGRNTNVWESSRASLRPHKNKMAALIKSDH